MVVVSANNTKTNESSDKENTEGIEDLVDAKRILREIKLLRHFNHENVVALKDLLPPSVGDLKMFTRSQT